MLSSSSKRSRKFTAFKAPSPSTTSSTRSPSSLSNSSNPSSSSASSSTISIIALTSPSYPASLRSLVLSLTNDRYPGAPGTALFKAREANEREITRQRREKRRLEERKEELERLGLNVNGGVVSAGGSSSISGGGSGGREKRARRSTPVMNGANGGNGNGIGGGNGKKSNARKALNLGGSIDPDSLPVPTAQDQHLPAPSTRTRRPASRGSSPVPLTGATTSPSKDHPANENEASSQASSRGASPDSNRHQLSSSSNSSNTSATTQPFQSSPLARDVTSANNENQSEEKAELGGRPLKRKASALINEIVYDESNAEKLVKEDEGSAKKKSNQSDSVEINLEENQIQPPLAANAHHTGTSPSPLFRAAIHSSPLAQSSSEFPDNSVTSANQIDPVVISGEDGLVADEPDLVDQGYGSDVSASNNQLTTSTSGRKRVAPKRLEGFHQPVRRSGSRATASPAPPANNATGSSTSNNLSNANGAVNANGTGNEASGSPVVAQG